MVGCRDKGGPDAAAATKITLEHVPGARYYAIQETPPSNHGSLTPLIRDRGGSVVDVVVIVGVCGIHSFCTLCRS